MLAGRGVLRMAHDISAATAQQRVRHAQHLLEATDLPVDEVAARAGMGTSASLRQHLRASVGVSPSA